MSDVEIPWYEQIVLPALLRHARTTYGRTMRRALEQGGYEDVPANGLYVIGSLAMGREGLSIGDLCRELHVSKQAAGQLVDALVLRGYLDRTPDPDDRRKLIVTLTERGRAAAAAQAGARETIDAALLAKVGPENIRAARRTLAALIGIGRDNAEAAEG